MGRRQAKIVGSVTTSFLSDGAEEIAEYDGAGGLLRRYIPGPGTDQPIAMVTPSGGSHQHSYFHTNRQGSTIAMSNDAGTVIEGPYTYDAYGQGAPSTGVPFKYTGRRLDPETGLYYYRARYYSAALGRFLQTDPIGYRDDLNSYAIAGGDSVNFLDSTGTSRQGATVFWGVGGTFAPIVYGTGFTGGGGVYATVFMDDDGSWNVRTGKFLFGGLALGYNRSVETFAGVAFYDSGDFEGLGWQFEANVPIAALAPLLGLGGGVAFGGAYDRTQGFDIAEGVICCSVSGSLGWGAGASFDLTWTKTYEDACSFCGWSTAELSGFRAITKSILGVVGRGTFRVSGRISSGSLRKSIDFKRNASKHIIHAIDEKLRKNPK
jgi:RHS repeat-associated protein